MPRLIVLLGAGCLGLLSLPLVRAEEKANPSPSVEQVAAAARDAVVVITFAGRDGKQQGLGTGFVVRADGLIATNLHVIGEGRPITVQLANGRTYPVTSVHASDRILDLALVRIDAQGLKALPLADADTLKDGQAVVALGNPHGLKHSVVSGVVSGKRTIDGRAMIQVAIPIERGNSGGPLLDLQGRVHGILTMKSLVTANLGFAVPVNALAPLLARPNPVSMARWQTFGVPDPEEWAPLFGARWRQRGGKLEVEGAGEGFGGRALCLCRKPTPPPPYEVAVSVRLDDEAGAAGLVFHADGGNQHYGFYPSSGQLRLTRFDGPDVFSWKVLVQQPSPHYRPGEWNHLKVRVEKEKLLCYVNGKLAIESSDTELTSGQVGLAKFRDTRAEFKDFQVGPQLQAAAVPEPSRQRILGVLEKLPAHGAADPTLLDRLVPDAPAATVVFRERARELEEQAARLREMAAAVHQKRVQEELARLLSARDEEIDLVHAALLLARLDNEELDVAAYRKQVERMAKELAARVPQKATEQEKREILNRFLFEDQGFHGSRTDYYNRANSYLSDVLDDREGLPITLSVLYMELARRIGLRVVGVGLPGHFVVRHEPAQGEGQLVDVFEGGQALSRDDADRQVRDITGRPLREEHLAAMSKSAILLRILHNLMRTAREDNDARGMLRYLDTMLAISTDTAEERAMRAALRFQTGDRTGALRDVDWLLEKRPEGIDLERVQELRRLIERAER